MRMRCEKVIMTVILYRETHQSQQKKRGGKETSFGSIRHSTSRLKQTSKSTFLTCSSNFPPTHRLHKICNRNNVKLSYCCMPNMATILSQHNKLLLSNKTTSNASSRPCNCRNKNSCPLEGDCRSRAVVYKATLTTHGQPDRYY